MKSANKKSSRSDDCDEDEKPLPSGWIHASIGQLCTVNPGLNEPPDYDTFVSFVPMSAVSDELGAITNPEPRPFGSVRTGYTQFINGDVIFAKITPCMENGKSAVARDLIGGIGCGSTEFVVLRSRGAILPDYLHRYLRQETYRGEAQLAMRGSGGHGRVPKAFIEQTNLPVPPLAEQRRIVARIEELEKQSQAARVHLSDVPMQLKRTRQAILTSEFSGINGVSYVSLAKACASITDGDHQPPPRSETGIPFIVIGNLRGGTLDLSDTRFVSDAYYASLTPSRKPQSGDVLVAIVGATIGLAAPVETTKPFCFQRHIALFRPSAALAPRYLLWFLRASETQRKLWAAVTGVAQPTVPIKALREIVIPLPPLAIQHNIVRRIDGEIARLEAATAAHATAVLDINRLDQAILARAFRGELSEQNSADESAQSLLNRLLAEEALQPIRAKKSMPRKNKRASVREIRSILDVLREAKVGLTPEIVFHRSGRSDSDLEQVEKFYTDIRQLLQERKIKETRPDKATVLLHAMPS
jgi:type I restriction enzyme, S subunit